MNLLKEKRRQATVEVDLIFVLELIVGEIEICWHIGHIGFRLNIREFVFRVLRRNYEK